MDEHAPKDPLTQSEKASVQHSFEALYPERRRFEDHKRAQRLELVGLTAIATVTLTESWQASTGGKAERWRDHVLADPWQFIAWADREGFGVMGWLTTAGEARCRAAISVWCEGQDWRLHGATRSDAAIDTDETSSAAPPAVARDVPAGVGGK